MDNISNYKFARENFWWNAVNDIASKPLFTCSKLTIERLEQGMEEYIKNIKWKNIKLTIKKPNDANVMMS